jgi:glyoxylase-like metal-dependent hydrolase (beta-lactamase superfamily II)
MFIQVFPSGPFSTNAYVLACVSTREAAIIDPAPDSASDIESFLSEQNLKPQKILLTHSHWDHIADVHQLKEKYHIPVFIHSLDAPNLQQPGTDGLPCWINIPSVQPDGFLQEGMLVKVGDLSFQVLHTPGHSPGCICLFEPQQHVLFSGDTLFKGTIGNLSFPTSQPSLMWPSLTKLAQLPLQTRVFPGHGPSTTIQAESEWLHDAKKLFDL